MFRIINDQIDVRFSFVKRADRVTAARLTVVRVAARVVEAARIVQTRRPIRTM